MSRRWGAALTTALVAAVVMLMVPPAAAAPGWRLVASRGSGQVTMATWDFSFDVVSGSGTGGHSYVHRNLLLGDTSLVDLRNTGTVPLRLSGSVTMTTVLGGSVSISTCPSPAVSPACLTGTQVVSSLTVLGASTVPVAYGGGAVVASGASVRLKVELKGAIGNEVRMTAVPTRRPPADRSAA